MRESVYLREIESVSERESKGCEKERGRAVEDDARSRRRFVEKRERELVT